MRTLFPRIRDLAVSLLAAAAVVPVLAQAPTILSPPLSQLAQVGQPVAFTVSASGGGVLSYQWRRNGQTIPGATAATLNLPAAARSDSGWYEVVVSGTGTARSVFALTVAADKAAVLGWGDVTNNQANVPAGLKPAAAVSAGWGSYVLGLDGSVSTWPSFGGPPSTVTTNAVAISTHSQLLALKSDGTVFGYGSDFYGQATVPAGLNRVVAVAAGYGHSLALKSDGTVVGWGYNDSGQRDIPSGLANVVAIAAGFSHSMALKGDGTVVAWGSNLAGQRNVPAGLANVIAISAGGSHCLALRADGAVVAWGENTWGQVTVPAGAMSAVQGISAGGEHSLAWKSDGTVVAWGRDHFGQVSGPQPATGVLALSGGTGHTLALIPAVAPVIAGNPRSHAIEPSGATQLRAAVTGTAPLSFRWKKNGIDLPEISGGRIYGVTQSVLTITLAEPGDAGAYSVEISNAGGTVTSAAAALLVVAPPTISTRPTSRIVTVGQSTSLTVAATGIAPLTYQWRRSGRLLAGATAATINLPSMALGDRGAYEVTVTAADGGQARAVCLVEVTPQAFAAGAMVAFPVGYAVPVLRDVTAFSAGLDLNLALQRDGLVAEWKSSYSDSTPVATGLNDGVAVAAGGSHGVVLRSNGTLAAAGQGSSQSWIPAGLRDVIGVAATVYYSAALISDGTVAEWGNGYAGRGGLDTAGLVEVVAIAVGGSGALALRANGTVSAWRNQIAVPAGLTQVTAIAAGDSHFLALKADGTVVGWGLGSAATVPAGLSGVIAISAGRLHSLALKADGSIVGWGLDTSGQASPPPGLGNVVAVAGGGGHSLALISASAPLITTAPASRTVPAGENAILSVTASGTPRLLYQWRKNGVAIAGATDAQFAIVNALETDSGQYSVEVRNSGGSVVSPEAVITVQEPNTAPIVRRVPESTTMLGGATATVSVVAGGAAPRSFQWYLGTPGDTSQPIAGATSTSVTLTSASHSQRVWVRITNALGSIDSPTAVVLRWEVADAALSSYPHDLVSAAFVNGRFRIASYHYNGISTDLVTWLKAPSSGFVGGKVAYGNGTYLKGRATDNSRLHTSPDGLTWTPGNDAAMENVLAVAHNGRLFLAVANERTIRSSVDGQTWTTRHTSAERVADLCHGAGLTVAIGAGGMVTTSPDGLNWTARRLDTTAALSTVIYANGKFVIASTAGELWLSTDGIAWTRQPGTRMPMGTSPPFVLLGGGSGVFLGVEYPNLVLSTDGMNWRTAPALPEAQSMAALAHGNNRFVLTAAAGRFLRSLPFADGITTTNQPSAPVVLNGNSATLTVVATGPGLQYQWYRGSAGDMSQPVAGANSATYVTPPLSVTTQYWARVWNAVDVVEASTFDVVIAAPPVIQQSPASTDILAESPVLLTASATGSSPPAWQWYTGARGDVAAPLPGATSSTVTVPPQALSSSYWSRATTVAGTADTATATVTRWSVSNGQVIANQITYFKGRYFAAGQRLLVSTDARTWSPVTLPDRPASIKAVAHNGVVLVVVGDGYVATSVDGTVFVRGTAPHSDSNNGSLCFGNGVFVTTYGMGGTAWSADGATWTAGTVADAPGGFITATLERVSFGSGRFVAVGTDNSTPARWIIFTSTDGRAWTRAGISDPTTPMPLKSVTFGGGQFVAVGYNRIIFTSPDGLTWTRRPVSSSSENFLGVAHGNGTFVIATSGAEILRSSDTTAWTSVATPGHFSGHAIEFVNGQFLAAGKVGWVHASADASTWTLLSGWPTLGSQQPFGTSLPPKSLAVGNGRFVVIGGETGAGGTAIVYVSTDGVAWSLGGSPGVVTSNLVFAQGAFLCAGVEGRIFRSTDAQTWTTAFAGDGTDALRWLIHNGQQWAGLTASNRLFLSSNGTSWSVVPVATPVAGPIASNGGVHVLSGQGQFYVSTNWRNWIRATGPSLGTNVEQIAYGNGAFVAAKQTSGHLVSSDGLLWEDPPSTGFSYTGVAFVGGRFMAFAGDGHGWSRDGRTWQRTAFDWAEIEARGLTGRLPVGVAASDGDVTLVVGAPNLMIARRAPVASGIVDPPVSQVILAGQAATLRVTAAGAGVSYQWFEGRSGDLTRPVAGAVAATFVTPNLAVSRDYWVRVSIGSTVQHSETAHVEVLPVPAITTQPADFVGSPGASVTFSVVAGGTGPLLYQWAFNGVAISGAMQASYSIPSAQPVHAGEYAVTVTNAYGVATSRTAVLRGANPAPVIQVQPVGGIFTAGDPVALSVTASGAGPLAFQWRCDGERLAGATTATLSFAAIARREAGIYDVTIHDGLSITTSQAVRVQVAPVIYPQKLQLDRDYTPRLEVRGGEVAAMARTAGGQVIVAGRFSEVNGRPVRNLARFKADGTIDDEFSRAQPNDTVYAVAVQGDGRIVIGGLFSHVSGQPRAGLARLNGDGTVDASFVPDADYTGTFAVAVAGGYVYAGGGFSGRLVRTDTAGVRDATFVPAPDGLVYALAGRPDGAVAVGGAFLTIGGRARSRIALLNPGGDLNSFASVVGFNQDVYALAVTPLGSVIAGGAFTRFGSAPANGIIGLTGSGERDPAWPADSGTNGPVYAVHLTPDNRILAGGAFGGYGGVLRLAVARILSNGILDTSFGSPSLSAPVTALAALNDGTVLIGGTFLSVGSTPAWNLARLSATGINADASFGRGMLMPAAVRKVRPFAGRAAIVAGDIDHIDGLAAPSLARLSSAGRRDGAFNPGGSGTDETIRDILLQRDDRIVAVGAFRQYNQVLTGFGVTSVGPDGLLDPGFATTWVGDTNWVVRGWARTSYVFCPDISGHLRRVLPGGGLDLTFDVGLGSSQLNAAAVQPDGKLVVGGAFTYFNGPRLRIARLLPSGTIDAAFNPAADGAVHDVAIQPDGRILVAGEFLAVNDGFRPRIARLNADGALDATFNPGAGPNGSVTQLILQEDGRVIVAGSFTNIAGAPQTRHLARLLASGAVDPDFVPPPLLEAPGDVALLDDGSLLIAGDRLVANAAGGFDSLVRLVSPVAAISVQPASQAVAAGQPATLSVTATSGSPVTYQWQRNGLDLPGATAATLVLPDIQLVDTGIYVVLLTNAGGTVSSAPAVLSLSGPVAPVITLPPASQAISAGGTAAFAVAATGTAPLAYQWTRDGAELPGATSSSLVLTDVQAGQAGRYRVTVSNAAGAVTSSAASLSVVPAGHTATHAIVSGSSAGLVTITNTLTYTGPAPVLSWQILLPAGWSVAGHAAAGTVAAPASGATEVAEWRWDPAPASPVTFTYQLAMPTGSVTPAEIAALVTVTREVPWQFLAQPDPLVIRGRHTADVNGDGRLSLLELTRVIELYNTRNGSSRTGCYRVDAGSEDGFSAEPARWTGASVSLGRYHAADANSDGRLDLVELTRVIQLYNHRAGSLRTGQYRLEPGTEDGFSPGP